MVSANFQATHIKFSDLYSAKRISRIVPDVEFIPDLPANCCPYKVFKAFGTAEMTTWEGGERCGMFIKAFKYMKTGVEEKQAVMLSSLLIQ